MDVAVVTGAASGPALASVKRLIGLGLRVYGIDADFTHCQFEHADFVKISAALIYQILKSCSPPTFCVRASSSVRMPAGVERIRCPFPNLTG